ncbi:MAG: hypothetical protein ABIQ40_04220 [Bacteroidia bacterium]
MSTTEARNDSRRIETLNVALSADTILYTPFFLAYYAGDFEDTPFGKLSVNIIGKKDDVRFDKSANLKGDGFATFCLIFGLADASICDPSYLVYLQDSATDIGKEFALFEKLLTSYTKSSLSGDEKFKKILSYNADKKTLFITDKKEFGALFKDKKVIGGLISKIAFSVACSPNLEKKVTGDGYKNHPEKFGKSHKRTSIGKAFTSTEVKGHFIYYDEPSTGFCVGQIHSAIYQKTSDKVKTKDFGNELKLLQEAQYNDSVAITCDYVSLDFLLYKQKNSDEENKVCEIEDLATVLENYLFTGILGNCELKNKTKLQALLYGIDKNLFEIFRFLKESDTTGLTKFFRRKFNYSDSKEQELLNLLIADNDCRDKIKADIHDITKEEFTFDTIIRYYVDRLYKWKVWGNLYYNKTIPSAPDLKRIAELRKEAIQSQNEISDPKICELIEQDLLSEWREKELEFFTYENEINQLELKEKFSDAFIFLFSPFLLFRKTWRNSLRTKLWLYVNKTSYLYTVGSLFLLFEIVSSMFHIFGFHIPKLGFNIPIGNCYHLPVNLGLILFVYLNAMIIVLILLSRRLLKLKENNRYIYRDEQQFAKRKNN